MKNIFHVGLISKNPKALETFYRQLLKGEPSFKDTDEYLEFDLKTSAVLDIEGERLIIQDLPDYNPGKFYLRLQVDDIDQICNRCKNNNIRILKGPIAQPYGKKEIYVLDPENNLIQFFQEI
jgi:catechol 2,3-dioxygenase-like lactoylglutathione lyase family enzyme